MREAIDSVTPMKKSLTLTALAAAAIISLTGCSDTGTAPETTTSAPAKEKPAAETKKEEKVPTEYKSALKSAESYSELMHMSKAGLYAQLTSSAGDKFSKEAAQYAIDNIKADWNANALESAKNYQEMMSMSPDAIHDQLTSKAGDQFTKAEADYAIKNLD